MKKLLILVLAVFLTASVFVLAACAAPGRIDFDEFITYAKESGFEVEVWDNTSTDHDAIAVVTIGTSAIVRFEQHTTEEYARARFNHYENFLRERYNSFARSTQVTTSTHGTWRFNSGGNHYLIQWVGTDFIYAEGLVSDRDAIANFLNAVRDRS